MNNNREEGTKTSIFKGFLSGLFGSKKTVQKAAGREPDPQPGKQEEKIIVKEEHTLNPEPGAAFHSWQIGEVIEGLYEVRGMDKGAFGTVYFVDHKKWNTMLAVKSPHQHILKNNDGKARFIREAETWVDLLMHPNITTCYYVKTIEDVPRIFIEYVEGGSLKKWLTEGKIKGWEKILDTAIQFCYGMEYAHSGGLIHRDIKPANCLMTEDGTLKITDFGLVKRGEDIPISSPIGADDGTFIIRPREEGMTADAGGMGTPEYMPPEQWWQAKDVGFEADIYSFGVMLFELVCGRRPFEKEEDDTDTALRLKHLKEAPPTDFFPQDTPHGLKEIILKCLNKKPEDRYHSFEPIREELKGIYSKSAGKAYPRKTPDALKLKADGLNNKALSLMDLGKEEEARKTLEEALKEQPQHLLAVYNLGLLQWNTGKITDEEFIRRLEEATISCPDQASAKYLLGLVHLERGDPENARKHLFEGGSSNNSLNFNILGLKYDRNSEEYFSGPYGRYYNCPPEFLNTLGLAYVGLEQYELARELFSRILKNYPHNVKYKLNLAVAFIKDGKKKEAENQLLQLISMPEGKSYISSIGLPLRMDELILSLHNAVFISLKLIRTFQGHTGSVSSVSFSPDGMYCISSGSDLYSETSSYVLSHDNMIRLWEVPSGKCLRIFQGHTHSISSVSFSPDGKYCISGSSDQTIKLWEISSGKCIRTFEGYIGYIGKFSSSVFSSDGRYCISGSYNTIKLWEVSSGKCIKTLEGHKGYVRIVSFSPDGKYCISGSSDQTIKLWEISSGKCIRTFEGYMDEISSFVFFSSDGRYFVSKIDNTIKLLEVPSGKCIKTLEGHRGYVRIVSFSPDGRYCISGSDTEWFKLWEVSSGKCIRTLGWRGESVSFSPDGRYFVLVDSKEKNNIKLFDLGLNLSKRIILNTSLNYELSIIKNIEEIVRDTSEVNSLLEEADSLIESKRCKDAYHCLNRIRKLTGYERSFEVLGTINKIGLIYGRRIGLLGNWLLREFKGHTGSVNSVALSPDGRYCISGSNDDTIKLWEVFSGKCIRTFEGYTDYVNSISFSSDGRYCISGNNEAIGDFNWDEVPGDDNEILINILKKKLSISWIETAKIEKIDNGKTLRISDEKNHLYLTLNEDNTKVNLKIDDSRTLALLKEGGRINIYNYMIKLWDVSSGKCIRTFEGHTDLVSSVSFSPDGRYCISGSKDKTIKLWDVSSGKSIRTFEGHITDVDSISFSPDGKYFISGSLDKIMLWEVSSGKSIKSFEGHASGVISVSFSPDGKYCISESTHNTLFRWSEISGYGREMLINFLKMKFGVSWIETAKIEKIDNGKTLRIFDEKNHIYLALNKDNTKVNLKIDDGRTFELLAEKSINEFSIEDYSIKLWDVSSGKCVRTFNEYGTIANSVTFSPDGRYFVSVNYKTIKLWEVFSGKCIRTFEEHTQITYVSLSPNGRYIISANKDKTIRLIELDWEWEFT